MGRAGEVKGPWRLGGSMRRTLKSLPMRIQGRNLEPHLVSERGHSGVLCTPESEWGVWEEAEKSATATLVWGRGS